MLSARLRLHAGTWDDTRDPVEIAYKSEPRGIWALRQMAAHARAKGEHSLALEADRQLIERTQRLRGRFLGDRARHGREERRGGLPREGRRLQL